MTAWDAHTFANAFAQRERLWCSYGIVDDDGQGNAAVRLADEQGNPSPYGPMINVTVQPSGTSIPCRLASSVAGDGEAEYYPFVPGDEVVVLLPEGDERAGALIIGRMNQELDKWPTVVAGQDATKNSFGFRRMRAPFVVETSAGYLIHNAVTGAQIGLDDKGQVIVNDGDKNHLVIGADGVGLTSGDGDTFVQLFPSDAQVFLGAGGASFLLDAGETKFLSGGTIEFATSGGMANQHAVTAEQVVALLINLLAQLATQGEFKGTLSGYAALPTPQAQQAALASYIAPALLALGSNAPVGPAAGGEFLEFQGLGVFGPAGAIQAAFANPVAPTAATGSVFGFGRPGFKL